MVDCWNCHRENISDQSCWVCFCLHGERKEQTTPDQGMAHRDNASPGLASFDDLHDSFVPVMNEKSTPYHSTPATGNSARQSTEYFEEQVPVHPKSFIETSNGSLWDDSTIKEPQAATHRESSGTCDFDFTRDGGPVVSFIRTSGAPRYVKTQSLHPDPPFGSIEVIPAERLPSRTDTEASKGGKPNSAAIDVQGWRRGLLVGSVLAGMFLGFLDTTIVAVALPTIAGDFNDYGQSTWVVTAYLLTYMGELDDLEMSPFILTCVQLLPSSSPD